jgi:hypothetical protein
MLKDPLYYSIVDDQGNLVKSRITLDPNHTVGEQQRLVKDQMPDYTENEILIRILPVPANQDFVEYQLEQIVLPDSQLDSDARQMRNHKLQKSDWTQLTDTGLTTEQRAAWVVYRQALRDVPAQSEYPRNINWPQQPE